MGDEDFYYRVVECDASDASRLESQLNEHRADGWRLQAVIPSTPAQSVLLVFEAPATD